MEILPEEITICHGGKENLSGNLTLISCICIIDNLKKLLNGLESGCQMQCECGVKKSVHLRKLLDMNDIDASG